MWLSFTPQLVGLDPESPFHMLRQRTAMEMLKAKGLCPHACRGQSGLGGRHAWRATSTITITVIIMITVTMMMMKLKSSHWLPNAWLWNSHCPAPSRDRFYLTNFSVLGIFHLPLHIHSPAFSVPGRLAWVDCTCLGRLPSGLVRCSQLGASAEGGQEGEGTGGWGWAAGISCHPHPQGSVALGMPPHTASLSPGSPAHRHLV